MTKQSYSFKVKGERERDGGAGGKEGARGGRKGERERRRKRERDRFMCETLLNMPYKYSRFSP